MCICLACATSKATVNRRVTRPSSTSRRVCMREVWMGVWPRVCAGLGTNGAQGSWRIYRRKLSEVHRMSMLPEVEEMGCGRVAERDGSAVLLPS